MGEPPKDQISGRHLIEGRGIPIEGGVFRRTGVPGITVDKKRFEEKYPWFGPSLKMVMDTEVNLLGITTSLARMRMPINQNAQELFSLRVGKTDRMPLDSFALTEQDSRNQLKWKATPDAQALFVGMMLEARLLKEKGNRRVAVIKDEVDGHAIVIYQGESSNNIHVFDPSKGDTKFRELPSG